MNLNFRPLGFLKHLSNFRRFRICSLLILAQISAFAEPTPTRVPSFGPNGTHWPGQLTGLVTPFMYDETVPHQIEVDPNWAAIAAAINGLDAAKVSQGVLIKVRPGTLVGLGGSSASAAVLNNVGNRTWSKRVTVCPRDGFGTVTITNGMKMERVKNICFAGFIVDGRFRFRNGINSAWAWTLVNGNISIAGEIAVEPNPERWEFVEFVKAESFAPDETDPMQLILPSGLTSDFQDLIYDGCYIAPNYMPVGHSAHQDTIQHLGNGGNMFSGIMRDTAIFASNRCAINGGLENFTFRNSWINARKENQMARYPVPSGADMSTGAGLSQGTKGSLTFDGGFYMGKLQSNTGIDPTPYDTVMNGAKIDYQPSGSSAPTSGKWIVDETLNGHTNPGYPPLPDTAHLEKVWRNGPRLPVTPSAASPLISPPGGVFDSQQAVTITSSTPNAVIRFTTDGSVPTSSSPVYGTPITVSGNQTIKALATKVDLDNSSVSTASFEIRVVAPVIVPSGGEFLSPQVASITTSTPGAIIYYTLDGSVPTASSSVYTAGIPIPSSATLKAIAIKPGLPASTVRQANFLIGGASFELTEDWTNLAISSQTSLFEISYTCLPLAAGIDAVTGVGGDVVENFSDLACIVRFAPSGVMDVRDGSAYRASSVLNYVANTLYRVRMTINVATKRYSVTVTPDGGSAVVLASNYAFRTDQSTLSEFLTFAFVRVGTGSLKIQSISTGPQLATGPSAPKGLRILR